MRMYDQKILDPAKNQPPKQAIQVVFNLVKGNIRWLTEALFGESDGLVFSTRNSICGCRGTDFLMRHDEMLGTDIVLVRDGVVDVTGKRSGKVIVRAGEQVRIHNGTPDAVEPLNKAFWQQLVASEDAAADWGGKATATDDVIRR